MHTTTHVARRNAPRGTETHPILRAHGLSIALLALFLLTMIGQSVAGWADYNAEHEAHGEPQVGYTGYLGTGHFLEATAENWESEFLQMFAFLVLGAYLYQRGSAESKKLGEEEAVDRDPSKSKSRKSLPSPVRRGGLALRLYSHSLSLTFLALFIIAFVLHAVGGAEEYNSEQKVHGGEQLSVLQYVATSRFWFESFQNWQSEFLALASMVIFTIFLRERGSPQSKPVDAPHGQTGKD